MKKNPLLCLEVTNSFVYLQCDGGFNHVPNGLRTRVNEYSIVFFMSVLLLLNHQVFLSRFIPPMI